VAHPEWLTIPESQFEIWSHQGGISAARDAYNSIRSALAAPSSLVREREKEIYLQGSYKNDTNIRADSDVDVVVELRSTFHYDVSLLPVREQEGYRNSILYPQYNWDDFRTDVMRSLRLYYGTQFIRQGNKTVKVLGTGNRVSADVLICIQHKKYRSYRDEDTDFVEGVAFKSLNNNRWIVNFPKIHYDQCIEKNSTDRTDGWFKPLVRMFKNARNFAVDKGIIPNTIAQSYFIEGLLYNGPDNCYVSNYQTTFRKLVTSFLRSDYSQSLCPNQQTRLFGNSEEQWSLDFARDFVGALASVWDNWE